MKIHRNIARLALFVLVSGCALSPEKAPFGPDHTYTTLDDNGVPLMSIKGLSDGWSIFTSHLKEGGITATMSILNDKGNLDGGVKFLGGLGKTNYALSNIRRSYFTYDLLVNQNYEEQADFIKVTKYYGGHSGVTYQAVIVEPVEFRGLHCMRWLTARSNMSHPGYHLEKRVSCPVVIGGELGNFGFSFSVNRWHATLTDLQERYGDNYLRLALKDVEQILKPSVESMVLHVEISQNPDDLKDYGFPPVPEGMTYTGFYMNVIPEQFRLLSLPYVSRTNRVFVPKEALEMKAKGLTLSMAKKWKSFFEETRKDFEVMLRESTVFGKTEEGIQIHLADGPHGDMARLFSEVIDAWDEGQ